MALTAGLRHHGSLPIPPLVSRRTAVRFSGVQNGCMDEPSELLDSPELNVH